MEITKMINQLDISVIFRAFDTSSPDLIKILLTLIFWLLMCYLLQTYIVFLFFCLYSFVLLSGSELLSCELFTSVSTPFWNSSHDYFFIEPSKSYETSTTDAKCGCLIDEFWAMSVGLLLFLVSTPAITAVLRKISCCVWESDWQQATNSQTAAEIWFTEINKRHLCCRNVPCSARWQWQLCWLTGWWRLPDWMTI